MTMAVKTENQGIETVCVSVNQDTYGFDIGRMYLFHNPRSDRAFGMARDLISANYRVLCVSRYHPDLVSGMLGSSSFQSVWLSERTNPVSIPACQLGKLRLRIESFLRSNENGVVVLEGIEYLSLFNDFPRLLRFIEELNDLVMEQRAILLIPVDPRSFDQRSLARIRRFSEIVR